MPDEKLTDLTVITAPAVTDLVYVVGDPAGTPVDRAATVLTLRNLKQIVNTQTGAVATGTTTIPLDDTIPQLAEGTEFLSRSITPKSASSHLKIDVTLVVSAASANIWVIVALFQDAIHDALAAVYDFQATSTESRVLTFSSYMVSGTTSATTFTVRAGPHSAATITVNGRSGARDLGGVLASSLTITEILG